MNPILDKLSISTIVRFARSNITSLVLVFGGALFTLLLYYTARLTGSDDTVFPKDVTAYQSSLDWVAMRYDNWSGRYFAEMFTYFFSTHSLLFWKVASLVIFMAFVISLYGYYLLSVKGQSRKHKLAMAAIAAGALYLMNVNVLYDGAFWISGAMNYFWISALAVIGFYPVAYAAVKKNTSPSIVIILVCLFAAIIGSTTEQSGTVLVVMCAIFLGYSIYGWKQSNIPFPFIPFIFLIATTFAWTIMLLAPGNEIRTTSETATWLPQLSATSEIDKLDYRIRWTVNALVNHSSYLLAGILATLSIAAFTRLSGKLKYALSYPLMAASLLLVGSGIPAVSTFTEFDSQWGLAVSHRVTYAAILFWIIIFALTVYTCYKLYKNSSQLTWITVGTLLLAAYASTAIVSLSPTLYVSGVRTYFVPSLLLIVTLYLIIGKMIATHKNWSSVVLPLVLFASAVAYIYMALLLRGPWESLTPYIT